MRGLTLQGFSAIIIDLRVETVGLFIDEAKLERKVSKEVCRFVAISNV